jgi:hypothetical protein
VPREFGLDERPRRPADEPGQRPARAEGQNAGALRAHRAEEDDIRRDAQGPFRVDARPNPGPRGPGGRFEAGMIKNPGPSKPARQNGAYRPGASLGRPTPQGRGLCPVQLALRRENWPARLESDVRQGRFLFENRFVERQLRDLFHSASPLQGEILRLMPEASSIPGLTDLATRGSQPQPCCMLATDPSRSCPTGARSSAARVVASTWQG